MQTELEPEVADEVPASDKLTDYDIGHMTTYLRLLDAEQDNADWREATRLVLGRDPGEDEAGARRCWESHMQRARWMTEMGYRLLLEARDGLKRDR
nr:DUF2285 domain-containing protein [Caulobacter segnis]